MPLPKAYFKHTSLEDIILHYPMARSKENRERDREKERKSDAAAAAAATGGQGGEQGGGEGGGEGGMDRRETAASSVASATSASSATSLASWEERERDRRLCFIHFLSGLLRLDPRWRYTPKQALSHPFLTGEPFDPRIGKWFRILILILMVYFASLSFAG